MALHDKARNKAKDYATQVHVTPPTENINNNDAALKAKQEAELKAKQEADALKAKQEAELKAKQEAEQKLKDTLIDLAKTKFTNNLNSDDSEKKTKAIKFIIELTHKARPFANLLDKIIKDQKFTAEETSLMTKMETDLEKAKTNKRFDVTSTIRTSAEALVYVFLKNLNSDPKKLEALKILISEENADIINFVNVILTPTESFNAELTEAKQKAPALFYALYAETLKIAKNDLENSIKTAADKLRADAIAEAQAELDAANSMEDDIAPVAGTTAKADALAAANALPDDIEPVAGTTAKAEALAAANALPDDIAPVAGTTAKADAITEATTKLVEAENKDYSDDAKVDNNLNAEIIANQKAVEISKSELMDLKTDFTPKTQDLATYLFDLCKNEASCQDNLKSTCTSPYDASTCTEGAEVTFTGEIDSFCCSLDGLVGLN